MKIEILSLRLIESDAVAIGKNSFPRGGGGAEATGASHEGVPSLNHDPVYREIGRWTFG